MQVTPTVTVTCTFPFLLWISKQIFLTFSIYLSWLMKFWRSDNKVIQAEIRKLGRTLAQHQSQLAAL